MQGSSIHCYSWNKLLQVTLGAQACSQSVWLPGLSKGTGKFAILALFTHSSVNNNQSRTHNVDTAHSKAELSQHGLVIISQPCPCLLALYLLLRSPAQSGLSLSLPL